MSDQARGSFTADAVLAGLTAFWGITFTVVKDALGDADPQTFLVLRFGLGAASLALFARSKLWDRRVLKPGLLLGVLLFGGYALQTWGLQYTTPSRSAFITSLCVVLVPLVSTTLLKRLPGWPALLGAALAATGLAALTGGLHGAVSLGDALTFGCAVVYAVHITLTERYAGSGPAMGLVGVQLVVVLLLSVALWPFAEHRLTWTAGFAVAVVVSGVFATAVAISLQTWAQARTTAVRAALLFALEPVVAAVVSQLMGRERLGLAEVAGGALIVSGVVFAELATAWQGRRPSRLAD